MTNDSKPEFQHRMDWSFDDLRRMEQETAREIDPDFYEQIRALAADMPAVIRVTKPERAPPQLLRDSTDGLHLGGGFRTGDMAVLMSRHRTGKSQLIEALALQMGMSRVMVHIEQTDREFFRRMTELTASNTVTIDEMTPVGELKKPAKTYMNDFLKQKQRGRRR